MYVVTVSDRLRQRHAGPEPGRQRQHRGRRLPHAPSGSSTGFQPVGGGYPIFTGQVYAVASPSSGTAKAADNNWTHGRELGGGPGPPARFQPAVHRLDPNRHRQRFPGRHRIPVDRDRRQLIRPFRRQPGPDRGHYRRLRCNRRGDLRPILPLTGRSPSTFEAASPLPPGEGQGEGASLTDSGVLSGAGDLTKLGSGILVLGGANSYGGNTTVGAGTLQVGNPTRDSQRFGLRQP